MESGKFSMYDLLGYLLPGSVPVLAVYYYGIVSKTACITALGKGAFGATALVVASFLAGHFIQAVATWPWSEKLLGWLTLGDARARLFAKGLNKLSRASWLEAKRQVLKAHRICDTDKQALDYDDTEAYQICLAASRQLGKTGTFNALFALNRGLSTSLILMLIICMVQWIWAALAFWAPLACLLLLVVQLLRLRQRGEHLVIEVVRQAQLGASKPSAVSTLDYIES